MKKMMCILRFVSKSVGIAGVFCVVTALAAVSFCNGVAVAGERLVVSVGIAPQKYFVQRIGGDLVEVSVMVPPGATAERYEPKPKQMAALSRSRVYFACGIPFEDAWLDRIAQSNKKMLVVHTEEGIKKRIIEAHSHGGEEHAAEGHGHRHEHEHEGVLDPHIWLSPPLVKVQARHIMEGLAQVDPEHREAYEAGFKTFEAELDGLDAKIAGLFSGKTAGGTFMVFHPAWGYFADRYGLRQVPVELEGKEPKAQELRKFIELAREQKIRVIFVQPQYSARTAGTIAEAVGGKLTPADDLAENWADNLYRVASDIAAAVE